MRAERSIALYVQDMLECIERVEKYCAGVTACEFAESSLLQDSVIYRLEVIGAAAMHVPQCVRSRQPDFPWRRVAGNRDEFIHENFGAIVERVWQVVTVDLPLIKRHLLQLQADLDRAELGNSG